MTRLCEVLGCGNPHNSKGYCSKHYQRYVKYGTTSLPPRTPYNRAGARNPKWRGGKSSHPLYLIYHDMVGRCRRRTHPRYSDYGGRGIDVCQRWVDDFWNFVEDIPPRPEGKTKGGRAFWQLDRIDNNGNYEPGNVRWATPSQQVRNQRPRKLQDTCRKGHPMTEDNTAVYRNGTRRCKTCVRANEYNRARSRERRARNG